MIFFFGELFIIPSLADFLYSPKARRTRQSLSDYPFCCKEFPWEYSPLLCLTLTHFDLDNLMEHFTLTLLPALFSSDDCVESESTEGHILCSEKDSEGDIIFFTHIEWMPSSWKVMFSVHFEYASAIFSSDQWCAVMRHKRGFFDNFCWTNCFRRLQLRSWPIYRSKRWHTPP